MSEQLAHLQFKRRPSPVMAEHRPLYKIGQLLLILHIASRGGRSRLPRLHLFNWALKEEGRRNQLTLAAQRKVLGVAAWGFDPALAIAIRFAIAEGLVDETTTGYGLSDAGIVFARELAKEPEVFAQEKAFLGKIGKEITETMVEAVASGWESQ